MKRSTCFLLIAALAAPLPASAAERMFVQVPAMIDPGAPLTESSKVRTECGIEMLLATNVHAAIAKRDASVQTVATAAEAGADQLLQLTITYAHGYGGGGWSGSKTLMIRADLLKGGAKVGSKVFTRSTGGGGGFSGTCGMFAKVTRALGKDVSVWLLRGAGSQAAEGDATIEEPAEAAPVK